MGAAVVFKKRGSRASTPENRVAEVLEEVVQLAAKNKLSDWLRRYLIAAKRAMACGDKKVLRAAATASSDYEAMMAALSPAALAEIAESDDLLAAAKKRGIEMMRQLAEARGGCIGATELAGLLKVTLQAVHQQRKRGRFIAVESGRKLLFPVWQFDDNWRVIEGLPEVLAELKKHGTESWDVFTFFLNPTYALAEKAPIDELKRGNKEGVLRAARWYDEHGAI